MIHRMLAANAAPTATALKRVVMQDSQELNSDADHVTQSPDSILNFLTHGGRSVGQHCCLTIHPPSPAPGPLPLPYMLTWAKGQLRLSMSFSLESFLAA